DSPGLSPSERTVVREQIAIYLAQLGHEYMVQFLTDHANVEPEDPYNGYFLYRVALSYREHGFADLALQYFRRAYELHPDVLWQNESIHFNCLQNMVELESDPAERAA